MLASDLTAAHQQFVVIDNSEGRVAEAQAAGYLALLGSASEERTLEAAGIMRARTMAAVLSDDTANVFVTLTARDLNPSIQIIARAEDPTTEKKLMRSGANRVVLPTLIGATKIAHMIVRPSAEDLLQETAGKTHLNEELKLIGLELTEIELKAESPLVGQRVGNVEVSGQGGFVVVAIKRADGTVIRAKARDPLGHRRRVHDPGAPGSAAGHCPPRETTRRRFVSRRQDVATAKCAIAECGSQAVSSRRRVDRRWRGHCLRRRCAWRRRTRQRLAIFLGPRVEPRCFGGLALARAIAAPACAMPSASVGRLARPYATARFAHASAEGGMRRNCSIASPGSPVRNSRSPRARRAAGKFACKSIADS